MSRTITSLNDHEYYSYQAWDHVAVLIMMLAVINCMPKYQPSHDKPVYMHESIGNVIDTTENEYYELFKNVSNFWEGRIYALNKGVYLIKITTADSVLISLNTNPDLMKMIQDYIERFEQIKNAKGKYEAIWHILDYDYLGLPIIEKEMFQIGRVDVSCLRGARRGCLIGGIAGMSLGLLLKGNASVDLALSNGLLYGATAGALGCMTLSSVKTLFKSRRSAIEQIKKMRRAKRYYP